MSCFIVDRACMTRAVRAIRAQQYGGPLITRFAHIYTDETYAGRDIGRALFALNARACAGRYCKQVDCPDAETFDFDDFRPLRGADLIACYKSLECLRYQCAEDATIESPLFVAMTEALPVLAQMIVHAMPAYDAAEWG